MRRAYAYSLMALTIASLAGLASGTDDSRGMFVYHAWKGAPGALFAEAAEVYTADRWTSTTQWLLITPERNRALVTREYDPKHDRWTLRFSDEESGWWAEETLDTSLRYVDLEDANHRSFRRLLEEKPSTTVTFRTADGLIVEASGPWTDKGSTRDSETLAREWLEREGTEVDLPATALEAIRFIVSLVDEGHFDEGNPLRDLGRPLAVLGEKASGQVQAPRYGGETWVPGDVEGTSLPAIQALVDLFDSDRIERSRAWIEATRAR